MGGYGMWRPLRPPLPIERRAAACYSAPRRLTGRPRGGMYVPSDPIEAIIAESGTPHPAARRYFALISRCDMILSASPYSTASSALKILSRSVSVCTSSFDLPVWWA